MSPLTRERVLDVASELFIQEGAANISLRKIASALGVTPMALYRHVENKEDLLAQVLRRGFEEFHVYLSRDAPGLRGAERLRVVATGFFAFALERASYFDLMFLGRPLPDAPNQPASVREVAVPTFKLLRDCVEEGMEDGDFQGEDPHRTAVTLLAQATGMVALHRTGLFGWSEAEARGQFQDAVEEVLAGILVDPVRSTHG